MRTKHASKKVNGKSKSAKVGRYHAEFNEDINDKSKVMSRHDGNGHDGNGSDLSVTPQYGPMRLKGGTLEELPGSNPPPEMREALIKFKGEKTQDRKPWTEDELAFALRQAHGLQYVAARNLGMSAPRMSQLVAAHPRLKVEIENAVEFMIDFAENKLFEFIRAGNLTATIFYLKTRGQRRGYVEQPQQAGGNYKINIVYADTRHNSPKEIEGQVVEMVQLSDGNGNGDGHDGSARS